MDAARRSTMPLTSQQTEELKEQIAARRRTLVAELREAAGRSREEGSFSELAGDAPDSGDESVASLIADLDQADQSRDLAELRMLEAARDRIKVGHYGVCAQCGGDIGFERLRASPGAVRCVECQRLHEKTFAGPGAGPSL
jgi:DnaK suppressor protein